LATGVVVAMVTIIIYCYRHARNTKCIATCCAIIAANHYMVAC